MTVEDEILDDLFHGCALVAFIEQASAEQKTPDPELTRRRAYAMFEAEKKKAAR